MLNIIWAMVVITYAVATVAAVIRVIYTRSFLDRMETLLERFGNTTDKTDPTTVKTHPTTGKTKSTSVKTKPAKSKTHPTTVKTKPAKGKTKSIATSDNYIIDITWHEKLRKRRGNRGCHDYLYKDHGTREEQAFARFWKAAPIDQFNGPIAALEEGVYWS